MTSLDHLKGIYSISLCFWGLFGLYTTFRIRRFIIKRYEQETRLSQTKYFKEWVPWAKYVPPFFRSVLYLSHLWKFVRHRPKHKFATEKKMGKIDIYDDIKSPEQVTAHFTKKEIRRVKMFVLCGLITAIHAIAYYVSKFIWPETFS